MTSRSVYSNVMGAKGFPTTLRSSAMTSPSLHVQRPIGCNGLSVHLGQLGVAPAEMMGDLVQHGAPNPRLHLILAAADPFDGPLVDEDAIRQGQVVPATAASLGHAPVEAQ